jgi:hypothetical protein
MGRALIPLFGLRTGKAMPHGAGMLAMLLTVLLAITIAMGSSADALAASPAGADLQGASVYLQPDGVDYGHPCT